MKIGVIGSGSWGTALSWLLANNGHDVCLWSYSVSETDMLKKHRENLDYLPGVKLPENITFTNNLAEAATGVDCIVMVTPSQTVRGVVKTMRGTVRPDAVLVSAAKGLENDTLLRMSQVLAEELPENRIAVLSGPSHAEEVGCAVPTTVVAASPDASEYVQNIFMSNVFRVYTSTDLTGVEIGGALKNCIALAAGISDGLGFGDNTKAAIMTRGLAEITRLGLALGARHGTFAGLAGIGDLIVTCTSPHSRNRRAGLLIGGGASVGDALAEVKMVVEGVSTTKAAYTLAGNCNIEMPIVNEMYRVLFEGAEPRRSVELLMERGRRSELDLI